MINVLTVYENIILSLPRKGETVILNTATNLFSSVVPLVQGHEKIGRSSEPVILGGEFP